MIDELILVFGTLFAIVNPFSTSFVFLNLTKGIAKKERRQIALHACIAATITLIVFFFSGNYILSFFGITIYAFRVAGGIYLALIGFEMLSPELRKKADNYKDRESLAIIPLAIPLLSGPGSLTTVLVLGSESTTSIVLLGIFLVMLISWVILFFASYIQNILGKTGTVVLERIMGIIVLVVSVQFVFNGITGYLATLGIGG